MTTTEIDNVKRWRAQHHKALEEIAVDLQSPAPIDGWKIWRKLRRIEREVSDVILAYSCDNNCTIEQWESAKDKAIADVKKVFGGKLPKGFFLNSDPRGHALKLEPGSYPYPMEKDWGGNLLLAAEIN